MAIKDLIPTPRSKQRLPVKRGNEDNRFLSLHREMNRLFDDFLRDFSLSPFGERFAETFPKIDLKETEKEVIVNAELPGLGEKDIDITLSHNILSLRGEKKEEKEEKGGHYYQRECRYGSFHRDIPLRADIDEEKVAATFRHGVLTITLPKKSTTKPKTKKVEIKVV
jgi:HSP20 family protein